MTFGNFGFLEIEEIGNATESEIGLSADSGRHAVALWLRRQASMLMAELRVIETRTDEVRKDVVATIRDILDKAERGELKAVAIAVVYSDGSTGSAWSQSDCFPSISGALARMQHRMQVAADDV